jgi:oligosaccharide reducing-end xylanase
MTHEWEVEQNSQILEFFCAQGIDSYANQCSLEGERLSSEHSLGLVSMNGVAGLAATTDKTPELVQALWDAPPPSGRWHYYDSMLYRLGLLNASGYFEINSPAAG